MLSTLTGGGICSSLVKLDISDTNVTSQGVREALERLVQLKQLECDVDLSHVVVDVYRSGERRPLALRRLRGEFKNYSIGRNPLGDSIIRLCPFLTHVDIKVSNLYSDRKNFDLKPLLELDNLQHLEVQGNISFVEDVVPVLQKFGHKSLDYLSISKTAYVSLGTIMEHCPNLRVLRIFEVNCFIPTPRLRPLNPTNHYLPYLQYLSVRAVDSEQNRGGQPSASDLAILLSSTPALVDCQLECLENLSDQIFQWVVAQHGFSNLEKMEVASCPNITRSMIDLFLEQDNPLTSIKVERYEHWDDGEEHTPEDYEDPSWRVKIKRNNLNVTIYYCECS